MALRLCARLLQRTNMEAATSARIVGAEKVGKVMDRIASDLSDGRKRLFAVVHINGRQFKVGESDLIALYGNLPLDVGDKIKLEKVLLVGSKNFTLIGRPLLRAPAVTVNATVVEKTTSYPTLDYFHLNHKQVTNVTWLSREVTVLRINEILMDKTSLKES